MLQDRFLRACRREPVDKTPVWFMRQAGRYQAEYRAIREKYGFMEVCAQPELAAEVTMLPVKQLGVDAAILFSDIMNPMTGMGIDFSLKDGVGPVVHTPVRSPADVANLRPFDAEEHLPNVLETIRLLRQELKIPLIGFVGAPFTLASYLVEGRPTKNFGLVKQFMYSEPAAWASLMEQLGDMVVNYLTAQVAAGAQAVQIFDSWIGALHPRDYRQYVMPHMQSVFARLAALDAPKIHFGVGTATLLPLLREAGGDVIGVDWREPLSEAWERIGHDRAVQGNLDPTVLLAPRELIAERTRDVLREAGGRPGHIFNLGHGVLPTTPVSALQHVVEIVHAEGTNE
jgi:uroporphyrinogen decarboxylase